MVALHDVSLAGRYCDRLTLLSEGIIAAEGSPADALTPGNLRDVYGAANESAEAAVLVVAAVLAHTVSGSFLEPVHRMFL